MANLSFRKTTWTNWQQRSSRMLKRNGQLLQHEVPGYGARFTDTEFASYNAAFATIERDYHQIESVKKQLERLDNVRWEKPDPKPFDTVATPDGSKWNAYATLLALPKSDVLLCRKPEGGEWAIIQRQKMNGPYTEKHGNAAVLLTGNTPRELVGEYVGQAEHTLRFMARNLTVQAQETVWGKYPDNNPSRVMRAISQRCALAVDNPEALQQTQTQEQSLRQSRGMSI
jgi:hypothetical protein